MSHAELVKRLRKYMPTVGDCREAADAIEALEQRVEELEVEKIRLALLAEQQEARASELRRLLEVKK